MTPTLTMTDDGPCVGVATAKLLLRRALENEQQAADSEDEEEGHKRAIKELTGAPIYLPPKVITENASTITPSPLESEELREIVTIKNLRPDE